MARGELSPGYTVSIPDGYTVVGESVTGDRCDRWTVMMVRASRVGMSTVGAINLWADGPGGKAFYSIRVRGMWLHDAPTLDDALRFLFKDQCDIEL